MAQKILRQTRTFKASAKDLYEAIMDSRKHAKFTGAPAEISTKVGGAISAHGGYVEGKNLELVPNKKIVQAWRGSDWREGVYSRATFAFRSAGKGKTKLTFTQSGIPDDQFEDVKKGWIDFYWQPLAKMLEKETSRFPHLFPSARSASHSLSVQVTAEAIAPTNFDPFAVCPQSLVRVPPTFLRSGSMSFPLALAMRGRVSAIRRGNPEPFPS